MLKRRIYIFIFAALCLTCQSASAETQISGDIEGDTFWSLAGSPYIINGFVNISPQTPGSTLTIDPGVNIKITNKANLNIFGNLHAVGTVDQPITLTKVDTEGDIAIHNSDHSELANIESAIKGRLLLFYDSIVNINDLNLRSSQKKDYGIMLFNSISDITNLNLESSELFLDNGIATIEDLNIQDGRLLSFGNKTTLSRSVITNPEGYSYAVYLTDNNNEINDLTINDSEHGIYISNSPTTTLSNLIINNVTNGLALYADNSQVDLQNSKINKGDGTGIYIYNSDIDLKNVEVTNFSQTGIINDSTNLSANGLLLSKNAFGLDNHNGSTAINNSIVLDNDELGVSNIDGSVTIKNSYIAGNKIAGAVGDIDATSNYWGHEGGPTINPEEEKLGDEIIGDVKYIPWLTSLPCFENCISNVMFIPGIMGSDLYDHDEKLWEGNDTQVEKLLLDSYGKSINDQIATRDIIKTFDAFVDFEVYKSFIQDLENYREGGIINDYATIPYDWRLSLTDILSSGIEKLDGSISYTTSTKQPYIINKLRQLAANSKSGKVTIVAHSNGGLLTKALINQLDEEASNLIDKVIFVAVPQSGTPKAIGALLHGYDLGIPFKLSDIAARNFSKNAPASYQLLPFADYYTNEYSSANEPYVTFEDGPATQKFIDRYGYAITNPVELIDFLTAKEGRTEPNYDDLGNPAIGNSYLLNNALVAQSSIDSTWQPPADIEIHQIAGIGEYTLSNIDYKSIRKCGEPTCSPLNFINELSYDPHETLEGDGTVILSSALALGDNIQSWWVDLYSVNKDGNSWGPFKEKHANILEVPSIRSLILDNILAHTNSNLPSYISTEKPDLQDVNYLSFILHSPLDLSAIDKDGHIVNKDTSEIPGAEFTRYGEVQTLRIPLGTNFDLVLNGQAEGSFTLDVKEMIEGAPVATSTFTALPTTSHTVANMHFPDNGLLDAGNLQLDYDGDGMTDFIYTPILGTEVSAPNSNTNNQKHYLSSNHQILKHRTGETELTPEEIAEMVKQLQFAIETLQTFKNQLSPDEYDALTQQLLEVTMIIKKILLTNRL